MQYIHQTHYGHMGEVHTARPIMAIQNNHVYEMKNGRPDTRALYQIRENKLFATHLHPNGESPHALFEIRGDKIHTTINHPNHYADGHSFEIKSSM
jgi:hypothetical protein